MAAGSKKDGRKKGGSKKSGKKRDDRKRPVGGPRPELSDDPPRRYERPPTWERLIALLKEHEVVIRLRPLSDESEPEGVGHTDVKNRTGKFLRRLQVQTRPDENAEFETICDRCFVVPPYADYLLLPSVICVPPGYEVQLLVDVWESPEEKGEIGEEPARKIYRLSNPDEPLVITEILVDGQMKNVDVRVQPQP